MNKTFSVFFTQILFIVFFIYTNFCKVYAENFVEQENKLNTLFEELHSMYKDAFVNEKTYLTRRLFTRDGNSHYTLHVQKLKEVDGVKTHNLRVEGRTKTDSPIIYINNPVEAGMPNPFLSVYEFKHAMRERVENQKKEFDVKRKIILNANKQFKANLDNFTSEIFDVKKHTELVLKNSTEKPLKISHKENKKLSTRQPKVNLRITTGFKPNLTSVQFIKITPRRVNKKRAQKVHVSHVTKSKYYLVTSTMLPTTDEKITTSTKVYNGTTVDTVADEEVTTESSGDGEITTESSGDRETTTESSGDGEITTESSGDVELTTQSPADEDISTVSRADDQKTTELITEEEIITHPETTTTTTTTTAKPIRTTRTRQKKPYVFMGGIDNSNNHN